MPTVPQEFWEGDLGGLHLLQVGIPESSGKMLFGYSGPNPAWGEPLRQLKTVSHSEKWDIGTPENCSGSVSSLMRRGRPHNWTKPRQITL